MFVTLVSFHVRPEAAGTRDARTDA